MKITDYIVASVRHTPQGKKYLLRFANTPNMEMYRRTSAVGGVEFVTVSLSEEELLKIVNSFQREATSNVVKGKFRKLTLIKGD